MEFRKIIDQFSRFFVGGLFIFSGLIKLNDPVGTEIKLEEYFHVFSTEFTSLFSYLQPIALEIGLILVVLEVVLGFALLLNYQMKITTTVVLLLMIFFTFLTGYSWITNAVTDCGCFGDAIKLTPKESFFKDLILMVFVLHLWWFRKKYQPVLYTKEGHITIGVITLICFVLGVYAIRHLPFIDFRAYKIGNHIPDQMIAKEPIRYEYIFLEKSSGKEIKSEKYLMDTTTYKYKALIQLNEDDPDTKPKITDYRVFTPDGEDMTQHTFDGAKLLFIINDTDKASTQNIQTIRDLVKGIDGKLEAMVLTSTNAAQFEAFRHEHQLAVPYYFVDATVLKTIVRSNPGITLWVNGTVKGMWHHNDTPTANEVLTLVGQ
ncbi:BT_3928 family protein [Pseudochryseolinea flava]|uniref:DoxX family protein n=1 Tax=Pseudochryseolinea flava TaxID=2059302 RepID=A0A364Y0H9_9BACT|nr:BT_3928 family protein [Pseudochryseolinea flava]RAV99782.1 DoxX family protein [Pseudochryseolinea flava]